MLRRTRILAAVFALAAAAIAASAQDKPDALILYRQGRDLEIALKQAEAEVKYRESIAVCDEELAADSKRMEAYVVKCWSLFRLDRHAEVIATGNIALRLQFDARAAEVMGESFFHLNQMSDSLKYLQKYIEAVGESGDRFSTAYFYMGEVYLKQKRYSHADMAYSIAVAREPNMPRWWFRLAQVCEYLSEWKRAYDTYGKALALNPSYQDALDGQARTKAKAGL